MNIESDMLRTVPLFSLLTEAELATFSACTQTALFEPHQTIYRAGDVHGSLYIVLDGKVRIFVTDKYSREITIAQCASGESFGRLPDPSREVCSDTAVALVA